MRWSLTAIVIVSFVFALIGCAGLPAPKDQTDTLAILPIRLETPINDVSYGRYALRIVSTDSNGFESRVILDPQRAFQPITGLPEGEYKIDQVTFYYNTVSRNGSVRPANVRFRTHRGQLTIIDAAFRFTVTMLDGKKAIAYNWSPILDRSMAAEVLNKLRQEKNFRSWQLSDETKELPQIRDLLSDQTS
jgi:hypothetical protein